ncbi:hypothetical protein GCM10011529_06470 [Polymorphobacter glacialis]|uniref:Uncharacterized protein n=1 Tax=Sandarakinorhabdus glacialis TaxID=1614636 RepID=A0A916ZKY9_9SPHN|nr:hypothetical protein [Polymorphobacter glacialis]GGE02700.1 hypothetical protein GCM10011529_06470 [Polymorphobacter glacialis]
MKTILSLIAAFSLSFVSIGAATVDVDATVAGATTASATFA